MADFERDFARRARRAPGAELPLAGQHPRRGQRADRQQPQAPGQEPVDRGRSAASRCACTRRAIDADEARWIVERGAERSRARARDSIDMAVLYRSNAQSRVLEHALFSAGIAYRVYGGLRFFERAEVKHALAYLRLVASPDDDNALLRVVNFPPRGIGARSVEQLQDAARAQGASLWQATGMLGRACGAIACRVPCPRRGDARGGRRSAARRAGRARGGEKRSPAALPQRARGRGPHREPGRTGQCGRGIRRRGARLRARDGRGGGGCACDRPVDGVPRRTPRSRRASTRRQRDRTRCS